MAPLTASTNTTRPTNEMTYLANRPSRRNQILSLTPIIQTLGKQRLQAAAAFMAVSARACLAQFEGVGPEVCRPGSPRCFDREIIPRGRPHPDPPPQAGEGEMGEPQADKN